MPIVHEVTAFLDAVAPPAIAEAWDNVGLLLGDARTNLAGVMTCLTLTPDVAGEAIREQAGLIVTHHPILFRPIKRLTTDTAEGATLLALAKAGIAVYSPHTAFDGAAAGINARICERLGLQNVQPLRALAGSDVTADPLAAPIGAGRFGALARPIGFDSFATQVRQAFGLLHLDAVPSPKPVGNVAVACGSAAEFLPDAIQAGCDVLVTGEARFHALVEARTLGIGLVLLGHYTSERFAVEELAAVIEGQFPDVSVWPSRDERDPLVRF